MATRVALQSKQQEYYNLKAVYLETEAWRNKLLLSGKS